MISGFELWRYYLGIKLHFTSKDYDAVKSSGHVTAGQTAYAKRRDRLIFEGLAAKFDQPREAIKYLVANFAYGHNNVMYDREVGQEMVQKWIKHKESLSRIFSNDMHAVIDYFEEKRIPIDQLKTSCIVLKLLKSNLICIESVNLLTQYYPGLLDSWCALPECTMIYESELMRVRKLTSFISKTDMCLKVWTSVASELGITPVEEK